VKERSNGFGVWEWHEGNEPFM